MAKTKHYGIKFPTTVVSSENTFFDLNQSKSEDIKSQLMHLIFTPVGQRLRKPNFGSRLIQFIFNPDDSQTWADIKSEIRTMVSLNVPNCSLDDIEIYEINDGLGLAARIKYSVTEPSGFTKTDEFVTNL